jgi:hypothetical protein
MTLNEGSDLPALILCDAAPNTSTVITPTSAPSSTPSQSPDPEIQRTEQLYSALLELDYKIHKHIAIIDTIPLDTSSSHLLLSEEA